MITDLARAGQTMLLCTHALGFVRRIADTVHVLVRGRIIESGPPPQVLDQPREPATRSFLGEVLEG